MQSGKIEVLASINGVLGALVGITAGCCVVNVWEALLIGAVGSFLANITDPLLVYWKVGKNRILEIFQIAKMVFVIIIKLIYLII